MTAPDQRYNTSTQLEHLQSKYVGTGHADFTQYEWAVNQHRDSIATYIGHGDLLRYFALAENEAVGRVKYKLLEKILQPCGTPPKQEQQE